MEAFGAEVLRRMREHENMRSRKGPAEQVEEQTVEQIKRKLQENLVRTHVFPVWYIFCTVDLQLSEEPHLSYNFTFVNLT